MSNNTLYPSFENSDIIDDYFIKGRSLWYDLNEIKNIELNRENIPDDVLKFLKSTALNEHGVSHYLGGYYHNFHNDYKLRFWSAMWAAEEYTHYIIFKVYVEHLK